MASTESPWIQEGPLQVRFREEHGHLVKETRQPDRNLIMKAIQKEREAGQRQSFLGGYKVGSIPLNDLPRVRQAHPGLFCTDKTERDKALVKFSKDPAMREYLIKRA
jgi:hypothetical protein